MTEVKSIKDLIKALDDDEEKVIIKSPFLLALCDQANELAHIAYSPLSYKRLLVFLAQAIKTIRFKKEQYQLVKRFIEWRIKMTVKEKYIEIHYFYYFTRSNDRD